MAGHQLEITLKSGAEVKGLTLSHEALDLLADGMEGAEFGLMLLRDALRNKAFQKYSTGVNQQVEQFITDNVSESD